MNPSNPGFRYPVLAALTICGLLAVALPASAQTAPPPPPPPGAGPERDGPPPPPPPIDPRDAQGPHARGPRAPGAVPPPPPERLALAGCPGGPAGHRPDGRGGPRFEHGPAQRDGAPPPPPPPAPGAAPEAPPQPR